MLLSIFRCWANTEGVLGGVAGHERVITQESVECLFVVLNSQYITIHDYSRNLGQPFLKFGFFLIATATLANRVPAFCYETRASFSPSTILTRSSFEILTELDP